MQFIKAYDTACKCMQVFEALALVEQAGSSRTSRQCYVAREDISYQGTSFNAFPGKAETQRRSNF